MKDSVLELIEVANKAKAEISKVIIGQNDAIDLCLMAIFSGQHALLEGVPGVAKTLLVKTLARVMACDFGRVQFTPDLMPTDITGTNVYDMKASEFRLVKGPIFCSFLLADEINRAPAKTQSALLQAMQEKVVTIDNKTYKLDENFTVFATQNPIEYEGTYPLPEAQKDRFMLKISIGYPERSEELLFARKTIEGLSPEKILATSEISPVIQQGHLSQLRDHLVDVTVKDSILDYIVDVIRNTRTNETILVGAGPRATQSMLFAVRVKALFEKRDFVTPDDVRDMVKSVLSHRVIIRPEYEMEGLSTTDALNNILKEVSVPK